MLDAGWIKGGEMPRKKHTPEQVINKLREEEFRNFVFGIRCKSVIENVVELFKPVNGRNGRS